MGHRTTRRLLHCLPMAVAAWGAPALLETAGLPAVKAKLSGHLRRHSLGRAALPPANFTLICEDP